KQNAVRHGAQPADARLLRRRRRRRRARIASTRIHVGQEHGREGDRGPGGGYRERAQHAARPESPAHPFDDGAASTAGEIDAIRAKLPVGSHATPARAAQIRERVDHRLSSAAGLIGCYRTAEAAALSFVYCSRSAYQRAETGTVKTPFDAETGQPPTVRFIVSVSTANVRRNNVSSRGVPAQSAAGSEVDPSRFVSTSNARATESASHDRR